MWPFKKRTRAYIVCKETAAGEYYAGERGGWTPDKKAARKFASRESAELVGYMLCLAHDYTIKETTL